MHKRILGMLMIVTSVFSLISCVPQETNEPNTYTVTWRSEGVTIETDLNVEEGTMPVFNGETPVKEGYEFSGWTPSLSAVRGNVTYSAQFTLIVISHNVTWKDSVGNIIEVESVTEGSIPTRNYSVNDTAEWDYTFEGWSLTLGGEVDMLSTLTDDITYYAVVSQVKKEYTLTFVSNGGSVVANVKVEYGTSINKPSNPSKEGFRFVAWTFDQALLDEVDWPIVLTENMTIYAAWNESVDILPYLNTLLDSYDKNPYEYIPDAMEPGSSETLVTESEVDLDFSAFVNLSNLPNTGFGEQWQMVLTNLEQSKSFFSVLNVVDTLTSLSVSGFNNYLDSNPGTTAAYEFASGIYNVSINFEDNVLDYIIDYTADIPLFGVQTVQIALSYNVETTVKDGRIQIGDANALRYVISEDGYQFGIRYLGVRRAYFEIIDNGDGSIEGSIFEYLGINDTISTTSAAQFFINEDYVSVVGNKAGAMLGFAGTINELYETESGALLGYEVRETLSAITYNTLWFNLTETSGITSIKKVDEANESNPDTVYINGSASAFVSKNVGGLNLKSLSRRYDIEFRTQYYYYIDSVSEELSVVAVEIPMLFVQEEQLGNLINDMNAENLGLSFNLLVSTEIRNQIMSDYDTLIDPFITYKETTTAQDVIDFIGTKYMNN